MNLMHLSGLLKEEGWSLHVKFVNPTIGFAVFIIHSEHHPAQSIWHECEFVQCFAEGLDDEEKDRIDTFVSENDCPFFVFSDSMENGLDCLSNMVARAKDNGTIQDSMEKWQTFLDKYYWV